MTTTFTTRPDLVAELRNAAVPADSAVIHIRDGFVVGAYAPDGLWLRVALPACPKESFIHQTACLVQEYL